ncbi:MAG: RNA-binding S4 domain-containing protein [Bacteroidetes bacterium]|nr:RNA-binding S4 domain-containing protein [Bacteroidota bacterium]MDA1335754.1 RNA-binding S4 domain-containing protein [Bacteroidota bacterium]
MNKQSFKVRTEFIDLLQLLKATGYAATGGEAKMMVEDGLISVNNELELRKRRKLRPGDEVQIADEILIALS